MDNTAKDLGAPLAEVGTNGSVLCANTDMVVPSANTPSNNGDAEAVVEIKSSAAWIALGNRRLPEGTAIINKMGDLHPYRNGPVFDAHTIHINECDKNFVFYWLRPAIFPNVKTIYLNSNPCDSVVLWRWHDRADVTLWLERRRAEYKERWAEDLPNVCVREHDGPTP